MPAALGGDIVGSRLTVLHCAWFREIRQGQSRSCLSVVRRKCSSRAAGRSPTALAGVLFLEVFCYGSLATLPEVISESKLKYMFVWNLVGRFPLLACTCCRLSNYFTCLRGSIQAC